MKQRNLGPFFRKIDRNKMFTFKVKGEKIKLLGRHLGYITEIYLGNVYFTLPGFQLNSSDTVIDLGSDGGVFTVLAAKKTKKVIAVEANEEHVINLEKNLKDNNCLKKVKVIYGIIGLKSGLLSNPEERKKIFHKKEADIIYMKDILLDNKITKVDFLKVDIEGSEFDLFQNNNEWLSKIEKIAMEIHPQFGNVKSLIQTIKDKGFRVNLVDLNKNVVDDLKEPGYLFAKKLKK